MPRKKVPTVSLREEQYIEKALKWRTGGGTAPDYIAEVAKPVVQRMYGSWKGTFGRISEAWWNAVVPILEAHEVPKLEHAKYRAFVNRYISKCILKKAQKPENVKADFVDLQGCDPAILDEITAKIGEIF
ncbi:MAG: hypothetical protein QXV75_08515 [Candidatus Bathyarchaeia archaeon]